MTSDNTTYDSSCQVRHDETVNAPTMTAVLTFLDTQRHYHIQSSGHVFANHCLQDLI